MKYCKTALRVFIPHIIRTGAVQIRFYQEYRTLVFFRKYDTPFFFQILFLNKNSVFQAQAEVFLFFCRFEAETLL